MKKPCIFCGYSNPKYSGLCIACFYGHGGQYIEAAGYVIKLSIIPLFVGCLMYVGYSVGSLQVENRQLTERVHELTKSIEDATDEIESNLFDLHMNDKFIATRCVCLAWATGSEKAVSKDQICNYKWDRSGNSGPSIIMTPGPYAKN